MLTLHDIQGFLPDAQITGERSLRVTGVSTDSRTLASGELFVALTGERFDGHEFLPVAIERGAAAVLVSRPVATSLPTITVSDTRHALGELARGWRLRFPVPVIAVVGSNGKTTTKEMLAAILAAAYGSEGRLATAGNLNNDIGVPLTLFKLRTAHQAAVIEIGMNHPGETAWLAHVAAPTIVLITNAQREHQEFMVSVEAVAQEHGLALAALPEDGIAVLPRADAHFGLWQQIAAGRRMTSYVVAPEDQRQADVVAVAHLEPFATIAHLSTPAGATTVRLATAGTHNVHNAAGAAAAALAAGVPIAAVHAGLEGFSPVFGRMQRRQTADGGLLIDDSYNANPDSVRAALEVLAAAPPPTLAILGDMGEVGVAGTAFHEEIGAYAKSRGITAFLALGEQMRSAVAAFGEGATHCPSLEAVVQAAKEWLRVYPRASVLVKGSRFMGMERVVAALGVSGGGGPASAH